MKSAAEWSNDFFRGKKFETIAELVREVREEALEAIENKLLNHSDIAFGLFRDDIAEIFRQLKEKP